MNSFATHLSGYRYLVVLSRRLGIKLLNLLMICSLVMPNLMLSVPSGRAAEIQTASDLNEKAINSFTADVKKAPAMDEAGDYGQTEIEASEPLTITGVATSQITVTLQNSIGQPVTGTVSLQVTGSYNWINGQTGEWVEIGEGQILTAVLTSTVAEDKTIFVSVDGVQIEAQTTVSFPYGELAGFLFLWPGEIAEPGGETGKTGTRQEIFSTEPVTLAIQAVDQNWNRIQSLDGWLDIMVYGSDCGENVCPEFGVELSGGRVSTPVTFPVDGNMTVQVFYEDDSDFEILPVSPGVDRVNSSVNTSAPDELTANGVSTATLQIHLVDQNNNDGADWPVSIRVSGSQNYVDGVLIEDGQQNYIGHTGPDGTISVGIASTVTEEKEITVRVRGIDLAQEAFLSFVPGFIPGLRGEYFNNIDLSGTPALTRIDRQINFDNWEVISPAPGIISTTFFSARWSGQLIPPITGTYTFYTYADDGEILWVNDTPIIRDWEVSGPITHTGSIELVAGQPVPIRFEYFQNMGEADVRLSWQSPEMPSAQVIPSENLSFLDTGNSFIEAGTPYVDVGLTTSIITISLSSAQNYPYDDVPVYLHSSGQGNYINNTLVTDGQWTLIGNTNAQGVITATLASTQAGNKLLRARADGVILDQTTNILFPAQPPAGIQVLVAGEIATPGISPGKNGTPDYIFTQLPMSVTMEVVDQYWNRSTAFNGEVSIASSDPTASLPVTATITNGHADLSVTWHTTGTQTLTVTLAGDPSFTGVVQLDVLDKLMVVNNQTITVDEQRYAMTELVTAGMNSLPYVGEARLLPGHEILVITMDGDGIGTYETTVVQSIQNGRVVLSDTLSHSYNGLTDKVMVQRVPYYPNVIVQDGGQITAHAWDGATGGVVFFRAGTITVETGGSIQANGLGFGCNEGPGGGRNVSGVYAGGSYGGYGGGTDSSAYGSIKEPMALGGGGRGWNWNSCPGVRSGGGIVRLAVTESIEISGEIQADGQTETVSGGAGGSVWISAGILTGSGQITANGGDAGIDSKYCGSGSGGRVAIDVAEWSGYNQPWQATGGSWGLDGSPGTIYLYDTDAASEQILVDNIGRAGRAAVIVNGDEVSWDTTQIELVGNGDLEIADWAAIIELNSARMTGDGTAQLFTYSTVNFTGSDLTGFGLYAYPGATLNLPADLIVRGVKLTNHGLLGGMQNLTLASNGAITSTVQLSADGFSIGNDAGVYSLQNVFVNADQLLEMVSDLASERGVTLFAENITVTVGGRISADGLGYSQPYYPGMGVGTYHYTIGGGGHGGYGGGDNGGQPYGSLLQPASLGSAGGDGTPSQILQNHNAGGGAIRLVISDTLSMDGILSANGSKGSYAPQGGGGGAGGSLWVTTRNWLGTGSVCANGGAAYSSYEAYGAGSGGRVAIYFDSNAFTGEIEALGSTIGADGSSGTIYLEDTGSGFRKLWIDGGNADARPAAVTDSESFTFDEIKLTRKGNVVFLDPGNSVTLTGSITASDHTAYFYTYGAIDISGLAELQSLGLYVYEGGSLATGQALTVRGVNLINYGVLQNATALTLTNDGGYTSTVRLGASGYSIGQPIGSYIFEQITVQSGQLLEVESDPVTGQGVTIVANRIDIANGAGLSADYLGFRGAAGTGGGPGGGRGVDQPSGGYLIGSGGGHGGYGGGSWLFGETSGGMAYGDALRPVTAGSAGGAGSFSSMLIPGGDGGGAIHLVVTDTITVEGVLSADGATQSLGGGGAGGSIWLEAAHLTGSGVIRANGGGTDVYNDSYGENYYDDNYYNDNGAGSGGRVAVYVVDDVQFAGMFEALGGRNIRNTPAYNGAAGTVYIEDAAERILIVDGYGTPARPAVLTDNASHQWDFTHLELRNQGNLEVQDAGDTIILTESNMIGDGTGQLFLNSPFTYTQSQLQYFGLSLSTGMTLTLPADFTVVGTKLTTDGPLMGVVTLTLAISDTRNSLVRLSALGHSAGQPLGTYSFETVIVGAGQKFELAGDQLSGRGVTILADHFTAAGHVTADGLGYTAEQNGAGVPGNDSSGAGHGGMGGNHGDGENAGVAYGSVKEPITLGSAGRSASAAANGGGAIHLVISDTLNLPAGGLISANGNTTYIYNYNVGAGAGGSIWISAGNLNGAGMIQASGGASQGGGGGGGGRISIDAGELDPNLTVLADRGTGYPSGEQGSIYLNQLDPERSSIAVSPVVVVTELGAYGTIMVTVKDSVGDPLSGISITVRLATGNTAFINGYSVSTTQDVLLGATNSQGIITATIRAETPGLRELKASSGLNVIQGLAPVTFIPGPVSLETSDISPTHLSKARADGNDALRVRVIIRDGYGNPISDVPVTLAATGYATVTQPTSLTDAYGVTYGVITDTIGEVVTVTASVGTEHLWDTAVLTFSGADLSTEISAVAPSNHGLSSARALAGYPITYTLTVSNEGLMPAVGVVLTDTLPAGVFYLSHTSVYTTETISNTVVWYMGTLPAGAEASIQMVASIDGIVSGPITNQLTTSTTNREDRYDNNATSLTTTVEIPVPELSVTPNMPTLRLAPGDTAVFTATIRNNGMADMSGITVDSPAYITWVTASAVGYTNTSQLLPPNQSAVVTITVSVPVTQTLGYYRDRVFIREAGGRTAAIALIVRVVDETRSLAVGITNDRGQAVADANIQLIKKDASLSVTENYEVEYYPRAEASTNVSGTLQLADLEVGTYDYFVQAANHQPFTGTLEILPGSTPQESSITLHALPYLSITPSWPQIDVVSGGIESVNVLIVNSGQAPLVGLTIAPPAHLSWAYLGVSSPLPELAPGTGISFTIYANPPLTVTTGVYRDTILIGGLENPQVELEFQVNVSSVITRDMQIQLLDEQSQPITNTAGTILLTQLEQATLQLPDGRKLSYNPQFSLPINGNGTVTFSNLAAGDYNYQVFPDDGYQSAEGSLALPAGGNRFDQAVTLNPDPMNYSWDVEDLEDGNYVFTLTLTYDSSSNKPGLLISPQVICQGQSDDVLIANPTAIDLYLDGGVDGLPEKLEPGEFINVSVFGAQAGSRQITVDFHYFAAVGDAIPFTLNPSSATSPLYAPGNVYVRPLRLDFPEQAYPFELTQPANDWISVTQVLTESNVIFFQLGVAPDLYLPEGTYNDRATFIFQGNGSTREATLNIEVTKNATGWQAHTWLELGPVDYETKTGSSSAWIMVKPCTTGSGHRIVPRYFNSQEPALVLWYTGEGYFPGAPLPVLGDDHQQIRLQLSQQAIIESENFNANLRLSNRSNTVPISAVTVDILVLDSNHVNRAGNFNLQAKSIEQIPAGGSVALNWLVLPNELGVTEADGEDFTVMAVVNYTVGGQSYSFSTVPEYITVYPAPNLSVKYALPYPSDPCTVFDLKATVRNSGPGTPRSLQLTKPDILIAENTSGMAISFKITGVTHNGDVVSPESWAVVDLGALRPGEQAIVVWKIQTNIAGRFVEFTSDHRQSNYYDQAWQSPMQIETYLVPGTCGAVPDDSTYCSGDDFCLGGAYQGSQGSAGGPINTRTGGYDYSATDLSIPTLAGPLTFERWYATNTTELYTATLGAGWTHSLDTRLIFPEDPGGQEGKILFKAHSANLYEFFVIEDGIYQAYPGMCASLVRTAEAPYVYTITDGSQRVYTFDELGRLITFTAPNGYSLHYEYSLSHGDKGVLERVSDDAGLRYLDLAYDPQGRIVSVSDHTERHVDFGYNLISGDLITVTDVLAQPWTYTYNPAHPHFVSEVRDPRGYIIERTEYDSQNRAVRQYNGENELVVELIYHASGEVTVRDGLDNSQTHTYDHHNTLIGVTNALDDTVGKSYNANFRPVEIITPVGSGQSSTQELAWSANGINLETYTDALGYTTRMSYDALNNLIAVTDTLTNTTRYVYGNADGSPGGKLLLHSTNAISQTTYYTYTTAADWPQPANLLKATSGPGGSTTYYQYNAYGQQTVVTNSLGLPSYFIYDDLGRLVTAVDSSGRANWTCYDTAGRVVRSVSNATGDGSTPASDPCDADNYVPNEDRSYDRINTTIYDAVGNVIATIDPNGIVTRIYYDRANRPTHTVRNLTGYDIYNPVPLPVNLIGVDENLLSQTVYTATGVVIANIEWARLGSEVISYTTRTYFDEFNRPEYVVRNLQDWSIQSKTPPPPENRTDGRNLTSQTVYDVAGNVIQTIDPVGRVNHTCYDKNNRVVKTIQNPSVADPCQNYGLSGYADQDVVQYTYYDANGNVIATADTQGTITRSYYDKLGRVYLVIRNLTYQGYEMKTPPPSSAFGNEENIATQTEFDQKTGAAIAAIEWLVVDGQVISHTTRTYYDSYQRPYLVIRNLTYQSDTINTPPPQTAFGNDENIASGTLYDSQGRSIASRQWLVVDGALVFQTNRTYYDEFERPYLTVRNLNPTYDVYTTTLPTCNRDGSQGEYNLCSETIYDADGRAIASIDAIGRVTRTYFDDLGRSITVVRNLDTAIHPIDLKTPPIPDPDDPDHNLRSDTVYDGRGQAVAQIEWLALDGLVVTRTRRTYSDALGRTTVSVQNLNPTYDVLNPNPPVCNREENGTADLYNLCFENLYDAGGQAIATTNVQGVVTRTYFDRLGRAIAVVRNFSGDVLATTWPAYDPAYPDQNVRSEKAYDRSGNLVGDIVVMSEAQRIVTWYAYDRLGRLTDVKENFRPTEPTNAETNVHTSYTYDARGNRLSIQDGNDHPTEFQYDALGRMVREEDALGNRWRYGYDALGRQIYKTDAMTQTTQIVYDGLGRLLRIDYPDPDADVAYTYSPLGWRTVMTDGVGVTTWVYDDLGRALTITDPFTGTVRYTYDLAGNRTSLEYPGEDVVNYSYDALGRLKAVTTDFVTIEVKDKTSYEYSISGQVLTTTLSNGVVTTNQYDLLGRVTRIEHATAYGVLSAYDYEYDAAGNRVQATEGARAPGAFDLLFADGFESGDFSAWSSRTVNADLTVSTAAALAGTNGMRAVINDNGNLYVQDDTPTALKRYRARFYFDPNSIAMGSLDVHDIFAGYKVAGPILQHLRIQLRKSGFVNTYQIQVGLRKDDNTWVYTAWVALSDAPHAIEFDWKASTAVGMNNGMLTLWVDGTQRASLTQVDNDTMRIDTVQMGAVSGIDTGTRGTYYFDAFESRYETYIGPEEEDTNKKSEMLAMAYIEADEIDLSETTILTDTLTLMTIEEMPITITFDLPADETLELSIVAPEVLTDTLLDAGLSLPETQVDGLNMEMMAASAIPLTEVQITYTYDALSRLTHADYSNDFSFAYTYDAVGNRLTQEVCTDILCIPTTYDYDIANRLLHVGSTQYDWDKNGNLLNDGVYAYTYNRANRLVTASGNGVTVSYAYNGNGDRLQQTANGVTTYFTLDLNTGLTQVLADGENVYLYGRGRIAETNGTTAEYYLGDALGSVRQLVDGTEIAFSKNYTPFGENQSSSGDRATSYGFTSEWADAETGLLFLRARYMSPSLGIFLAKDKASFDVQQPSASGQYIYANGNPVNLTDPSGWCVYCKQGDRVKVDGRPNGLKLCGGGSSVNCGIKLAKIPDLATVWVENGIEGESLTPNQVWRQVTYMDQNENYYTGWVPSINLLDSCQGQPGMFADCWPINADVGPDNHTEGFGPNQYAKEICSGTKYPNCIYYNTRGLHNGLDFPGGGNKALIWIGVGNGRVNRFGDNITGDDAAPNIVIEYGGVYILYGHVNINRFVQRGSEVRPGQTIGMSGDQNHLHLGVRMDSAYTTKYYNPLLRFSWNYRSLFYRNMSPYPQPWNAYAMYSFDGRGTAYNGTDLKHLNFWEGECNLHYWEGIEFFMNP